MATLYSMTPTSTSVAENVNSAFTTFTITRSGDLPAETLFATALTGAANGFSTNNQDFGIDNTYSGFNDLPIAFSAGQTSVSIMVLVNNDMTAEGDERFGIVLQRNASDPLTTFIARSTFTVYDDDSPPLDVKTSIWGGGNGNWSTAANWDRGVPTLGLNADIGQKNITVTFNQTSGAARKLNMADTANSLSNAGTLAQTGGTLELGTFSRLGGFTQTAGTLIFDNAYVRPDNSLDFQHPDAPGTVSEIGLNVDQDAAGTIRVVAGSLELRGSSITLGGALTGAGAVAILGSATLESTAVVNVASLAVQNTGGSLTLGGDKSYAGIFTLGGVGASVRLGGHTLTLSGQSTFDPTGDGAKVAGLGTLSITGTATGFFHTDGAAVIRDAGLVNQTGNSDIGTNASPGGQLQIVAGKTWNIVGDVGINLSTGAVLNNAGTFAKAGGSGTSLITGGTLTNTGTIDVQSGTLFFTATSGTIGGHLTGAGKLILSTGAYTLQSGAAIDVAAFQFNGASLTLGANLSYGGAFTLAGIGTTLQLNGKTLTLSGSATFDPGSDGAFISGAGTLKVTGTATGIIRVTNLAVFENAGTVTQASAASVGTGSSNGGEIRNDAGKTWNITTDAGIDLTSAAKLTNAGLFEKTGGSGTSSITGGIIANTGTIKADSGILAFNSGQGSLGGRLTGTGEIDFAGNYTLANGIVVDVAKLKNGNSLTLGGNLTYSGALLNRETLNLAGNTLTLTGDGSVLNGVINGGGTVVATGDTTVGNLTLGNTAPAVTLRNSGAMEQLAGISLNGSLINDAGASILMSAASNITNLGNGGAVTNNGLFTKDGDTGTGTISTLFTNNGSVVVDEGSLVFTNFTNIGIIEGVVSVSGGTTTVTADTAGQLHLTGGSGNNVFDVTTKPTHVDGGAGTDTLAIKANMSLAAGSLVSVEKITVANGLNVDLGNLTQGEAITVESVVGGTSKVHGTQGDDVITSGAGNDILYGNGGNDRFYVDSAQDIVVDVAGGGTDYVLASATYGLKAKVEVERLSTTDSGASTAISLSGNEFAQRIDGNAAGNKLSGLGANDTIYGNGGNDALYGGTGKDVLVGGLGNDSFLFDTALDAATNVDTIADFHNLSGDNDTIRLENAVFAKLTNAGALNPDFFAANATGTAADGNDYVVYNTGNGALFYDADGNGAGKAVLFALLTGHPSITAADFLIV